MRADLYSMSHGGGCDRRALCWSHRVVLRMNAFLKELRSRNVDRAPHLRAHYVRAHYDLDWSGAEDEYAAIVAMDPGDANALYRLGLIRGFSGRIEDRQSEPSVARQLEPHWAPAVANTAFLWTLAGRYAEVETHSLLGDENAAFDWLEKAVEERSTVALVPADPALPSLRAKPRFREFLARRRVRGRV